MPLTVEDRGRDNMLAVDGSMADQAGHIVFRGSGNSVRIGAGSTSLGIMFDLGDDCRVEIGSNVRLAALEIYASHRSLVAIGDGTASTWKLKIHTHEPHDVTIGRDCLISDQCWITASDMHSIMDKATGRRINPGRPVRIGDHVWLGALVTVLKGATIGDGSIIGAGAVVSGAIGEDCLAAGNPVRVLRTGVTWDERLL